MKGYSRSSGLLCAVGNEFTESLESQYNALGQTASSEKRKEILQSVLGLGIEDYLQDYISQLSFKEFREDVYDHISLSGAGMAKVRLFEHEHGSLRYHIFSEQLKSLINEIHGIDPHVHNFQALSKLLTGNIIENRFTLTKPTLEEINEYERYVESQGLTEDTTNCQTFFDEGYNKQGTAMNRFVPIGIWSVEQYDVRRINAGETYFLPAEVAHVINVSSDTTTLCATDKTYVSNDNKKDGDCILRGHGKKNAWEQKLEISREVHNYGLTNYELFTLLKESIYEKIDYGVGV